MIAFRSPLATIDNHAILSEGVTVWHFTQIREGAFIGENTTIGKSVYVDANVEIGRNCKIQNNAQLFSPCSISDFVFIGPGTILTNDKMPRATLPDGKLKLTGDWTALRVVVKVGASIGANTTCIAPLTIGKWAMIGAGSVVTRDVPDYALVFGNPAKQIGWVGEAGKKLTEVAINLFRCPLTLSIFALSKNGLVKVD